MTDIYKAALQPLLFSGLKADPEFLHGQSLAFLQWLGQSGHWQPWLRDRLRQSASLTDRRLTQTIWGQVFANPIGLAAGFDKDGVAAGSWSSLGFGFAELGTVTLHAQPGNPRPRLFRLPLDQAALNRMGFNNAGAAALAERMAARRQVASSGEGISTELPELTAHGITYPDAFPIGINLGKSKITPLEAAAEDYLGSFELLQAWGDYFVVNVSSPNTPGLRSLQATDQLEPILAALQQANQRQVPLLIKIAPDLTWEAIREVIDLAQKYHLAGIIATNTTIQREGLRTQIIPVTGKPVGEESGGISGAPVRARSTEVIRFIYQETAGKLPIIGVGGVFTADDAWEKITAGASLVQVYTGWIYEGPWMVRRILAGLLQKLEAQGLSSIEAAIGLNSALPPI